MREESDSNHICILKTGRLLDHDLAANALTENGIPFYKQMETVTGLKLAMPFQPAMAPGTYYKILVPERFAEEAKQILSELPIDLTVDPDLFHFGASKNVKKGWKLYALVILAITAIIFLVNLVQIIR
ncbi:MAG: hypothetical protein HY911_14935 [Desulfobacterales bacterium]|nr:hypothetical protein [Desulfobacterales bacterium]